MADSKKNLFGAPPKGVVPSTPRVSLSATAHTPKEPALKILSVGSLSKTSSVNFGSVRKSSSTSSTSQSSQWTGLIKQAASGGIGSIFSGGFGGIGGLGGLVSGIVSLFDGGKSTPAPLVPFSLPQSQQQTVTLHAQPTSVSEGLSVAGSGSQSSENQPVISAYKPAAPAVSHSQVVTAVKQALLNSSSLNDVIADI